MATPEEASPADSPCQDLPEIPAKEEDPASEKEGERDQSLSKSGDPSGSEAGVSSSSEEQNRGKALAEADELMQEGSEALKAGDYAEGVDCYSRAVAIRVAHYGELSLECASAYYKYGCALLYKAQNEADPLANVPKKETVSSGHPASHQPIKIAENSEGLSAASGDAEQVGGASDKDEEEGVTGNILENDNEEGEDDGEDLAEVDEEDSDLDLAWNLLEVARAIVEKHQGDTLEKADILAALGEVSLEREDIVTSLSDYREALSILERLVEPDSRRLAELNFRICLALEVGSKVEDAIPYCQKAISICKARLQRLKEEVNNSPGSATTVNSSSTDESNQNDNKLTGVQPDSSILEKAEEIETLGELSSELEKKLEDLQQVILDQKSIRSEVLKIVGSKAADADVGTTSSTKSSISSLVDRLISSQEGVTSVGFNCPAAPTNATNGNVTHLGVVGRGVKRAVVTPTAEPSPKKTASDTSVGKDDTISQV